MSNESDPLITDCTRCGHPCGSRSVIARMPTPRAARRRHAGGICSKCYAADRRPPSTGRSSAGMVSSDLQLTDWHWLHETGELDPADPLSYRVRVAAPRIGVSVTALEKVLWRAGIRNPVDPTTKLGRRKAEHACQRCRLAAGAVTRAGDEVRRVARLLSRRLERGLDAGKYAAQLAAAETRVAEDEAARDAHLDEHAAEDVAA